MTRLIIKGNRFQAAQAAAERKDLRRRMRRAAEAAQRATDPRPCTCEATICRCDLPCADCGERGERTGHAACPEAGRVSDREVRGEAGDLYDVQGVER